MILQQIYSGNHVPNFIKIAAVFIEDIAKNILVSFFLDTLCIYFIMLLGIAEDVCKNIGQRSRL